MAIFQSYAKSPESNPEMGKMELPYAIFRDQPGVFSGIFPGQGIEL